MTIMPILRSLLARHKTAAALIVLEIALTCAIVSNAVFLIRERLRRMDTESGIVERELVRVQLTGVGRDTDAVAQTQRDREALRQIPGVESVTITNQVPLGMSSWNSSLSLEADQPEPTTFATTYMGDDDFVETLGLRVIAGRTFERDDYLDYDPSEGTQQMLGVRTALITRSLARRLYPGRSGVGEVFYVGGDDPVRVVGVVEQLIRPTGVAMDGTGDLSVILPFRVPYTIGGNYLIRTAPTERARVLGAAVSALMEAGPSRIVLNQQTFEEIRATYFRGDRAMAWLLVVVCAALLIVTALGIVGLATFWVQQRTRQLGVRRALGATRGQIVRHVQLENLLLTTAGIALGMALAYAMNAWLMQHYELPRLPAMILPAGAISLWGLGQVAVLGPALRAAAVPPAVATRSL